MGDIVLQVTGLQCFQADAVYISASADLDFNRLRLRLSHNQKADVTGFPRRVLPGIENK